MTPDDAEARLLAGEIDEDTGPDYVLEGRVVTMDEDGTVLKDGQVAISKGRVAAVAAAGEPLPDGFSAAKRVATKGTVYPGLIDLHNHFVYNVLPLWKVPKLYQNRTQWPRAQGYSGGVSLPVRTLAESPPTAKALVRYVEAKAVLGGTTTGQGMRTQVKGGPSLFKGAMRNVEETKDKRLPEAATLVPNLFPNAEGIKAFRNGLTKRTAYFYHLAEGVDANAHKTFTDLADNDLIAKSLVGIHCLGLKPADLKKLAREGGKLVWSPFSNLLLYGRTLDLDALKESGVTYSLGCDWSPTGSKNLLEELKVARWENARQGNPITSEDLVRAVTTGPARAVGWEGFVGTLGPDAFADVLVLSGSDAKPFDQLIDATEEDVRLVCVHGMPRYGDRDLMKKLQPQGLEEVTLDGAKKAFHLQTSGSLLNDISFKEARSTLRKAMSDLPAYRKRAGLLSPDQAREFTVELDNEWEPTPEERQELGVPEAGLMADWSQLVKSVPLDGALVGEDDYWERIEAQPNIDDELKQELKAAYGG